MLVEQSSSAGPAGSTAAGSSSAAAGGGAAGAMIKAGISTPTAAINPVTVADQGGLDMLAQTGEYLCLSGQDLKLKPVLAESWTPNATSDVWTFKIRQGVKFHDGTPLTADDVVYTYKLQTDPKGKSTALSAFGGVLTPDGVVKKDAATVEFHLAAPNGNFPYLTSSDNYNMIIIPNNYDPARWEKSFIGTGPFKLGSYTHEVGGVVHPQRGLLGHQGAAIGDPVHLLRHADAGDPRADQRRDRRPGAVLGGRRGAAADRRATTSSS